jgi:hypothetical protein
VNDSTKPVLLEKLWRTLPRVAAPYQCKSCGWRYDAALDAEVECSSQQFMREIEDSAQVGIDPSVLGNQHGYTVLVHERWNAFMWCDNPKCSRFYDHATGRLPPRLRIRRKWLPLPKAANERPA